MLVYRICNEKYSTDLSGTGAKKFGGRWNQIDTAVLYASEHISLAAFEILVHNGYSKFQTAFSVITLEIPKGARTMNIDEDILLDNWILNTEHTQAVGTSFLQSNYLICKVPSAIIREENNFLLNPAHPDFDKVRIVASRKFEFEQRLF
jgi:RES domain-containing protein